MLLGLWLSKSLNQVRGVMVAGASCLLALSVWLTIYFVQQRAAGNTDVMLLTASTPWFKPLNIAYSVGVDGISVVMLLLSSIIVFTGTFASWRLQPLTKEYFLWFTLLSTGVYGFFICTDLFTMFGAGGNRPKVRRYEMGETSGRLSDLSVITEDNSRYEDVMDIIEDIKTGINKTDGKYVVVPNRRDAIRYCMQNAEDGDIIVLAGKGHEDYQEIKGVKYHMDEREIVADILKEMSQNK